MINLYKIVKDGRFMNTPIHTFLEIYSSSGAVRCHMPGGKGQNNPYDITEINGADSLYECDGIILESENIAASLFGAGASLYSCGGSTLAIQGMLGTLREISDKNTIIAGRYSHKSLINSAILLGYGIKWAYPEKYLSAVIPPYEIERLIDNDTAAVFVSSVDYYGGEADIAAISAVCRKHNIPLLVDNAHGAYRVFTKNHPLTLGADMTADSAHKTLPALTGAAHLHLKDSNLRDSAKRAMNMFGSSSPSYLILDSLDLCNTFISGCLAKAIGVIHNVNVLKGWLSDMGYTLRKSDPMRITIDAAKYGYTGTDFAEILREKGAEAEMSDERYVVLLFSAAQNETDLMRLYKMLRSIPIKTPLSIPEHKLLRPEKALSPRDAYFGRKTTVKTEEAAGKICAGIHTPCPPCVPLVMAGEVIDHDCISELLRYGVDEVQVLL